MNGALRMAGPLHQQLLEHAARFRPREAGAIVLIGRSRAAGEEVILARRAILLEDDAYEVQERYRLILHPRVINSVLALCEANNLGVMFCHSHPGDIPYSISDDEGERRLFEVFRQFLPDLPFASLLLCPGMTLGRVWRSTGAAPLVELQLVGDSLRRIPLTDSSEAPVHRRSPEFDRQELALGAEGQAHLARTRVAIVGLGGTGSPTAEQVVRLGVRDLILVDRDIVDDTTLTRGYGTFHKHIAPLGRTPRKAKGVKKVTAIKSHLQHIAPECRVRVLDGDVVETAQARALLDRHVIFCCVDEHWARAVLNQIAYQFLIPTVNMGVRLDVRSGRLIGAAGSIQVLRPGAACLWCAGLLDPERIRAEGLSVQERERLLKENYVVGLNSRAPAVISLTTAVSALAVTAFLHLVTGFLGPDHQVTRQNYFIDEGEVRPGTVAVREGCLCGQVIGFGDLKALPTVDVRHRAGIGDRRSRTGVTARP